MEDGSPREPGVREIVVFQETSSQDPLPMACSTVICRAAPQAGVLPSGSTMLGTEPSVLGGTLNTKTDSQITASRDVTAMQERPKFFFCFVFNLSIFF